MEVAYLKVTNQVILGDPMLDLQQPEGPSALEIRVMLMELQVVDYERRLKDLERRTWTNRFDRLWIWLKTQFRVRFLG